MTARFGREAAGRAIAGGESGGGKGGSKGRGLKDARKPKLEGFTVASWLSKLAVKPFT
jgi:hypothetical protein